MNKGIIALVRENFGKRGGGLGGLTISSEGCLLARSQVPRVIPLQQHRQRAPPPDEPQLEVQNREPLPELLPP